MKKHFIPSALLCMGLALVLGAGCTQKPGPVLEAEPPKAQTVPDDAWQVPVDVADANSQESFYTLAWESFIALNWPASGAYPGQPDTTKNITDSAAWTSPTVWLGWMVPEQVFLANAANPGTWASPTVAPAMKDGLPVLGGLTKFAAGSNDGEFDEAFSDSPLIDQKGNYVFYDVRMNESEVTYIIQNQYYNAQNQINAVESSSFVGFSKTGAPSSFNPQVTLGDWAQFGATEMKVSWRILTPHDDASRYYTMQAYASLPDGTMGGPYTFGLVGLHILRLTPSTGSTWYWATFEQVDNLTASGNVKASFNNGSTTDCAANGFSYQPDPIVAGQPLPSNQPVNVCRMDQIPQAVQDMNAQYQSQLKGTPWQYYQLVNTLNPWPNGPCSITNVTGGASMNTCTMYNVTLETYTFASSPQCNSCHQFGFPQGNVTKADSGNYQVFSFLLGHAQKPAGSTGAIKKTIALLSEKNLR